MASMYMPSPLALVGYSPSLADYNLARHAVASMQVAGRLFLRWLIE